MSFNVGSNIATANHFIGLASTVGRELISAGISDEDSRRAFWVKFMLPKLTEAFLDEVIAKPEKCMHFQLDGFDDENSPPPHIVAFQSFAHLCVPLRSVSSRFVPYQFRFILSKSARAVLDTSLQTDNMLRKDVFDKAGWAFWITETGFCLAPQTIVDELDDLAALRTAWMKTRDEYELPASFGAAKEVDPLLAHLPPVPPALERLAASLAPK
jgi:hypothetical protein